MRSFPTTIMFFFYWELQAAQRVSLFGLNMTHSVQNYFNSTRAISVNYYFIIFMNVSKKSDGSDVDQQICPRKPRLHVSCISWLSSSILARSHASCFLPLSLFMQFIWLVTRNKGVRPPFPPKLRTPRKCLLQIYTTILRDFFCNILPFNDRSNVPAAPLLRAPLICQDDGGEVCGGGGEGLWEAVGNRARHRSQPALSGHWHKAYTQLQCQIQYQWYCLMQRELHRMWNISVKSC